MSPDSKRRPRSDASRNRARLVAAAREALAEAGNDVAFDVIAQRAGVGNATLYRHFPTRADLLVAVYADEVAALCRHGEQLLESAEPTSALFAWLDEFVVHVATKRALALAATEDTGERHTMLFRDWHASITSIADRLVRRAQPTLRSDLTATDVLTLASGAALSADAARARRLVALLRSGIAASTSTD
ncbi:TetR/AcrR family transcriptional regulator [Actinoplanes sp. M2I2]|uniref:TetR/AcrR family transcriptional regulator n=1 Tax=Actinoplanes sp. M2I2 TaxID=1734444 RepID=UPI00202223CF|nr:TetR/AcrR family transcriptional regulator [Actinoplanes sp. M2I2]